MFEKRTAKALPGHRPQKKWQTKTKRNGWIRCICQKQFLLSSLLAWCIFINIFLFEKVVFFRKGSEKVVFLVITHQFENYWSKFYIFNGNKPKFRKVFWCYVVYGVGVCVSFPFKLILFIINEIITIIKYFCCRFLCLFIIKLIVIFYIT